MRITWRSIDWLSEDDRTRIEARLKSMAGEGGGADRVEITSRSMTPDSAACTEVRISGVIKKCQLTAVREHSSHERALNDALDAFERSVTYALQARRETPPAVVGSPAFAGAEALGGASFGPMDRITGSFGDVLRPLGSFVDRVSAGVSSVTKVPKRVLESRSKVKRKPPKASAGRKARAKRGARSGIARQAVGGVVVLAVAAGGFLLMRRSDQLPQVSLQASVGLQAAVEEPIAYRAIAGEARGDEASPPMFSAVAGRLGAR